jgi:hypothetical protein
MSADGNTVDIEPACMCGRGAFAVDAMIRLAAHRTAIH